MASPASPSWEDKSRLRAIPNSARGQGHRPYCVVFLPGILGLPSNFHSPWCWDSQIPVTYGETKAQVLSQGLPHVSCPASFLTLRPQLEVVPTLFLPISKAHPHLPPDSGFCLSMYITPSLVLMSASSGIDTDFYGGAKLIKWTVTI